MLSMEAAEIYLVGGDGFKMFVSFSLYHVLVLSLFQLFHLC